MSFNVKDADLSDNDDDNCKGQRVRPAAGSKQTYMELRVAPEDRPPAGVRKVKMHDQGWFYHAPARHTKSEEPVLYPAMSQIPGLTDEGGLPPDDSEPRPLFRDTDTKYVRLAKEGGRKNLLYMKENSPEKREPVGYPRNEWFYLYDNELEDEQLKQKQEEEYAFMRPDYMVHQPNKTDQDNGYERPQRGPLGYDRLSAFERDGNQRPTDKTVKLPEVVKTGYGVRSGKPMRVPKTNQAGAKASSAHTEPGMGHRPMKYLPMRQKVKKGPSAGKSREKPRMPKLLAYAYDREWHEDLANWQAKQETGRTRHRQMLTGKPQTQEEKATSEYTVSYGAYGRKDGPHKQHTSYEEAGLTPKSGDRKSQYSAIRQTETQKLREAKLKKPEDKEMFKLTRFKNVPARIETHRQQQQQPQAAC